MCSTLLVTTLDSTMIYVSLCEKVPIKFDIFYFFYTDCSNTVLEEITVARKYCNLALMHRSIRELNVADLPFCKDTAEWSVIDKGRKTNKKPLREIHVHCHHLIQ